MSLLSRETRVVAVKLFLLLLAMYILMHSVPIALSSVSFLGFIIVPFVVLIHRVTVNTIIPVAAVYGFFYDIDNGVYFGTGFLLVVFLFFVYRYTRQLYNQSSHIFALLNYLSVVVVYNIATAYLVFPLNSSYFFSILLHIAVDYLTIITLRILIFRKV